MIIVNGIPALSGKVQFDGWASAPVTNSWCSVCFVIFSLLFHIFKTVHENFKFNYTLYEVNEHLWD